MRTYISPELGEFQKLAERPPTCVAPRPTKKDVPRLDVPVHHLQAVHETHSITDLGETLQHGRFLEGHPTFGTLLRSCLVRGMPWPMVKRIIQQLDMLTLKRSKFPTYVQCRNDETNWIFDDVRILLVVLSPPNSRLDGSTQVATIGKVHDQAQPAGPHEDLVAAPWSASWRFHLDKPRGGSPFGCWHHHITRTLQDFNVYCMRVSISKFVHIYFHVTSSKNWLG